MHKASSGTSVLTIDIGGSRIKSTVLDSDGKMLVDYTKIITPMPATPQRVLDAIKVLIKDFPPYDKVSVGFPGYVKNGVILTAPNLDTRLWQNFNLTDKLRELLEKPVKVVNDADLQGLGVISGKGLEIVITLGTGFGTAILQDGMLLPHLELAHHPITKHLTYDQYIGESALQDKGHKKWNKRMFRVLQILKTVFNYDHLYIGGGNSSKLNFPLEKNMTVVSNRDGIKGGIRLWYNEDDTPGKTF
ncbi:MAG: ROK family protein [Sphingobacteriaceae bacterium]